MARVLLIEDDPHQRQLAALVLASGGHEVREAGNGDEGLACARAERPDLVVCDVVMPHTNGYQFVAAVRADPALCTLPIILLTSLSERAQVRVGMTAGADDYLPKPFRPEELLEAAQALLDRRRVQAAAIAGTVRQGLDQALEEQREALASRYEHQLLREINARWTQHEGGRELKLAAATLLAADLFALLEREAATHPQPADLLQRAHQAASDALYLFGAQHVLQHGGDLLAVFAADESGAAAVHKGVRAAFALHSAIGRVLGASVAAEGTPALSVALEVGDLTLVRLQDPLHGDLGTAAVPGPALERTQALRQLARERGWWLATSGAVADALPPGVAGRGRQARLERPDVDAVEFTRQLA